METSLGRAPYWAAGGNRLPRSSRGPTAKLIGISQEDDDQRLRWALTDRMAAIGRLAAGVGYEINDPATLMLANTELAGEHLEALGSVFRAVEAIVRARGDDEVGKALRWVLDQHRVEERLAGMKQMIGDIMRGAERLGSTVRDLRALSWMDRDELEPLDVDRVVDTACALAYHEVRPRARLVKQLGRPPLIAANRALLCQALIDLISHAARAIPEGNASEHRVTVSTRYPGDRIVITVQYDGPAIVADEGKATTDPFAGASGDSPGTGYGLSIAAEVVRKHSGTLDVRREGDGACIEVVLPDRPLEEMSEALVRESGPHPAAERRCRVLVVDDEPLVRSAIARILKRDHDVYGASDGAEALEIIARDEDFDLVICDLTMPVMDGIEFFQRLQRSGSELAERTVFATGGPYSGRAKDFVRANRALVLDKPFSRDQLRGLVRAVGAQRRVVVEATDPALD